MATLIRKAVKFPEVTEATLNKEVAERASYYLGYSFGERRSKEVTAKLTRREQLVKVQGHLKSLGIVPLDNQRVLRYQAQVRRAAMRRTGVDARWSWRMVDMSEYKAEIPMFALDRASSVAKRLNERMPSLRKSFAISELHRTRVQKARRYDPDPFMVLRVLDQDFYLDVWNEPAFEGRRTV